ncbi:MAG: LTA synthase family protein [Acidobacteria bacterium]|nr:LTA synthase family protein [Acidobacteriota bacterium]
MIFKHREVSGVRFLALTHLALLTVFSAGRLVLFLFNWKRLVAHEDHSALVFLHGLRHDVMTACILLVIPTFLLFLIPKRWQGPQNAILKTYLLLVAMAVIFMEIASVPFLAEFDSRPNDLFINYLAYPHEVGSMIFAQYKLALLCVVIVLSATIFVFTRYVKARTIVTNKSLFLRLSFLCGVLILQFMGVRSSLGHRPANLSDIAFSNSHLVNEVTKNATYTLGYTIYSRQRHSTDIGLYGELPTDEAIDLVRSRLSIENSVGDMPFLRQEETHFPRDRPLNLVVILEESLGSQFVASFGGQPGLTPYLDALSQEGHAFQNLYATGIRSVRGMEAVVAGFLPVPGESVVKRTKAQSGFFTVAQLLKPLKYESSFIYGGERRFDNMGHWYLGNGFDLIIDEKDFDDPIFRGIWGVCDEDLFNKAHEYFQTCHAKSQPFVSIVFTTSFHTPFEFPSGRIADDDLPANLRAVKYADYALGAFFEKAKSADYFEDTVFLVIADHDARVFGRDLVPIEHFKVPGLIIGPNVTPHQDQRLLSQPDATATALDFIGISLEHPILGRSVFSAQNDVAFMQYHDAYALMTSEQVAIVLPGDQPKTFDRTDQGLQPGPQNIGLERDLLAFIHTASYLYENRLHRLRGTH